MTLRWSVDKYELEFYCFLSTSWCERFNTVAKLLLCFSLSLGAQAQTVKDNLHTEDYIKKSGYDCGTGPIDPNWIQNNSPKIKNK